MCVFGRSLTRLLVVGLLGQLVLGCAAVDAPLGGRPTLMWT